MIKVIKARFKHIILKFFVDKYFFELMKEFLLKIDFAEFVKEIFS